jgi:hypothetical protein
MHGLAELSASSNLTKGQLFFVFKMYCDGSGKDDSRSSYLTLACVAADADGWDGFDEGWRSTLRAHPLDPSYLHMNEAFTFKEEFVRSKGWDLPQVLTLVESLNAFVQSWPKPLFNGFVLSVHLVPYRYWKSLDPEMPSASRECARRVFAAAYKAYIDSDVPVISSIEAFYDRDETFLKHIHKDWNNKRIHARLPFLKCLKMVAQVASEDTPAVQVADMIAWSANRVKTETDPDIQRLCISVLQNSRMRILEEIDAPYLQKQLSKVVIL